MPTRKKTVRVSAADEAFNIIAFECAMITAAIAKGPDVWTALSELTARELEDGRINISILLALMREEGRKRYEMKKVLLQNKRLRS